MDWGLTCSNSSDQYEPGNNVNDVILPKSPEFE